MSVKYQDNTPSLILERKNRIGLAIRFMMDGIQRTSNPNTPKQHGNLRADVVKSVNATTGTMIWDKTYAAAQEVGKTRGHPIKKYTTPGTGPHYAQKAVEKETKRFDTYLRRVGL